MVGIDVVGVGAALTLLVTVSLAAASFAYNRIMNDIEDARQEAISKAKTAEEVARENEDRIEKTHRVAETALASVYGDEDRPEDDGFIVESKEKHKSLNHKVEQIEGSIDRLKRQQNKHNRRMNILVDAIAEEMGVDVAEADGGQPSEAGGD